MDFWTQNMLRYSIACLFWLPFLIFCIRKGPTRKSYLEKSYYPFASSYRGANPVGSLSLLSESNFYKSDFKILHALDSRLFTDLFR